MICRHCQQENDGDARFCKRCGRPQLSHDVSLQPAVLEEAFDVTALTRLREEKHQLSQQLNAMLTRAEGRAFTADEERAWHELYDRWKTVADELTARMDYLSSREERDRRQRERREAQRRKHYFAIDVDERRDGADRRQRERRGDRHRRTSFPETPAGDSP
jgi:hypothetical protein